MIGLRAVAFGVFLLASCGNSQTFKEKYDVWSADLLPGFKIVTEYIDGQRCYCKIPNITTTVPPSTTTTTPPSTTTNTIPSTTTTPDSTTTTPAPPTPAPTTPAPTTPAPTTPKPPTPAPTTPAPPTPAPTTPEPTTPAPTTPKPTTPAPTTPAPTTPAPTTPKPTTPAPTTPEPTTPAPTTPFPTTTTEPPGLCGGNCNKTIIVNDANYPDEDLTCESWSSPNYPNDYPDGCDCCLRIHLQVRGYVFIGFQAGDSICANDNCEYDRLDFYGDWSELNTRCDTDLSGVTNFLTKNHPAQVIHGMICFVADFGDGNCVAKGFNMSVCIQNFHNRALPNEKELRASKGISTLGNPDFNLKK